MTFVDSLNVILHGFQNETSGFWRHFLYFQNEALCFFGMKFAKFWKWNSIDSLNAIYIPKMKLQDFEKVSILPTWNWGWLGIRRAALMNAREAYQRENVIRPVDAEIAPIARLRSKSSTCAVSSSCCYRLSSGDRGRLSATRSARSRVHVQRRKRGERESSASGPSASGQRSILKGGT